MTSEEILDSILGLYPELHSVRNELSREKNPLYGDLRHTLCNLRNLLEYHEENIWMNKIKQEILSRGFTKEFTEYIITLAKNDTVVAVNLGLWYINRDDQAKKALVMSKLVSRFYEEKR